MNTSIYTGNNNNHKNISKSPMIKDTTNTSHADISIDKQNHLQKTVNNLTGSIASSIGLIN